MTTDNVTPIQRPPASPVADELHGVFHDLSCAISVVKMIRSATEDDDGIRDQAMSVAIEQLDAAYNALDRLILRIAHEGVKPWVTA